MLSNNALEGDGRLAVHFLFHEKACSQPRCPVESSICFYLLLLRCQESLESWIGMRGLRELDGVWLLVVYGHMSITSGIGGFVNCVRAIRL